MIFSHISSEYYKTVKTCGMFKLGVPIHLGQTVKNGSLVQNLIFY